MNIKLKHNPHDLQIGNKLLMKILEMRWKILRVLDEYMLESEILYLEADQKINLLNVYGIYTEAKNENKIAKLIDSIIEKIKEMIDTVRTKVSMMFSRSTGTEYEKEVRKMGVALRKDPTLRGKKVKVKDTKKLSTAFREAVENIKKSKNERELEEAVNKYKKQRNGILAVGGLIIITAGALLIMGQNKAKNEINQLEAENKKLTETIRSYREKGKVAVDKDRKDDISDGISSIDALVANTLKRLNELAREYSRDTLKAIAYNLHAIREFNNLVSENLDLGDIGE